MSIWVLSGLLMLQGGLGMFLFMFVVFSACGIGNCRVLPKWQERVLGWCMFVVPGSAAGVGIWLVLRYCNDQPAPAWWWQLLPVGVGGLYLLFSSALNKS